MVYLNKFEHTQILQGQFNTVFGHPVWLTYKGLFKTVEKVQ